MHRREVLIMEKWKEYGNSIITDNHDSCGIPCNDSFKNHGSKILRIGLGAHLSRASSRHVHKCVTDSYVSGNEKWPCSTEQLGCQRVVLIGVC